MIKRKLLLLTAAIVALACVVYAGGVETGALERAFKKAADKVSGAVVAVEMKRDNKTSRSSQQRRPMQRGQQASPSFTKRPDAPVSGVLIEGGYVLTTNFNVSGNVSDIKVTLSDGRRFKAKFLGRDETRDLGLLKVETEEDLPSLTFAKDHKLEVGEFIIVIGRSENVTQHSVTTGIVSSIKRGEGKLCQIDANLNFGNTGGAIVNLKGEVLGIASCISESTSFGKNSGVGFMTPAAQLQEKDDTKKTVLERLKAGKVIKRPPQPFLGVQAAQTSPMPGTKKDGAHVAQVHSNTAADEAGMKDGDIITEFNGTKITEWMDLINAIKKIKVGDKFTCKVKRKNDKDELEEHELEGVMGARPLGA